MLDEKFYVMEQTMALIEGYLNFRRQADGDFPLEMKHNLETLQIKHHMLSRLLHTRGPEFYVNTWNGDLLHIHWIINRPSGAEWAQISEQVYYSLYDGIMSIRRKE